MLVVQHNCGQGYISIVMALEMTLSVEVGIVMIQKPFIDNWEISHNGLYFH